MKIIITAGGTGGHIYPALAIINKIKEVIYYQNYYFDKAYKEINQNKSVEKTLEVSKLFAIIPLTNP